MLIKDEFNELLVGKMTTQDIAANDEQDDRNSQSMQGFIKERRLLRKDVLWNGENDSCNPVVIVGQIR